VTLQISPQRRDEILEALRRGTVPSNSLDAFAVGLERLVPTLDEELHKVSACLRLLISTPYAASHHDT